MALKAELEQWHLAVEYFDAHEYEASLELFRTIADSAKIHFNIGLILGRKGDHVGAMEAYDKALELDQYLVVAYFQRGVARMVLQDNVEALSDFNSALKYLRDNEFIDYTQIGLDYKVYTCEVMYNRALCFFCLGQEEDALADLADASKRVAEERHSWIKKAVASNGMDCPLYCVPKGVVYRPSASKLKSTKKIDFLGSAKVIASADGKDNFTGFKGALVRKETLKKMGAPAIAHQKSMRVRRTTPPPEMTPGGGLARSNTMPVHRHEASSVPQRPGQLPQAQDTSLSMPPAAMRMRSAGNIPTTNSGATSREATPVPATPKVHTIDYGKEADDDVISTSSSAFSTPSATPTSAADVAGIDAAGAQPPVTPKSAMKKPSKNGAVDPLDIIRAGLARRTTLKNQQRQQQQGQQQGHQRLNLPQRSATMKQMGARGQTDSDGDDYVPNQSRLAGQLRSNMGAGQRSDGPSPAPPGAQIARTEIIMPVIQRSNTDVAMETSPTEYSQDELSPEYYNSEQPPSAFSSMPHPGLAHAQTSGNPAMMTPPLSHEELAARGIAGISISQHQQQQHQPPRQQHQPQHHQAQINAFSSSSSISITPSPASPAPVAQYGSLNGAAAGGLRRAPTKKDAMKVKVHFGEDIINLMVPKMASFDTLRSKISTKLASAVAGDQTPRGMLRIQYLDEDGEAVLMTDEDDFELAKAYAGGDMSAPETNTVERLELWCVM